MNKHTAQSGPLSYLALLVLGVFYLTTSYAWYNLNHYKLLVAWSGCALLLVMLFAGKAQAATRSGSSYGSWLFLLWCLLPVLTTLPGLLLTEGRHAYFFGQEVALWLICCSWMLVLIRLLDEPEKLAEFLLALAFIVIAVAGLALWRSLGGSATPAALQERESGTFGNPNYLACFLVMHIPLFGLCALSPWQSVPDWQGRTYPRVIFLVAALLSLVALFFTQSRVAMAVLVVILAGLCVLTLCMRRALPTRLRKRASLLLLLLVLACAALPLLFPDIAEALTSRLRSTPESRLVAWRAALASIREAPWFGWGPGSSYSLFFQYVDPASRLQWHERSYAHPHNELLEILQEGGILGMLGYLAFIGLVVMALLRLLASTSLHREFKLILLGIACALVAYHLAGLASVDTRMAVVRLGLFTLLALLFCLQRFSVNPNHSFRERSAMGSYAGILMLLTVSGLLLLPDLASRYRYVHIMQQGAAVNREQLLEDLRDDNPNVYALEQLVQMEIARGDFSGAERTLDRLDRMIPNYSISGYLKAVSYMLQGRIEEARAAALDYQMRDLYMPENARLLAKLAIIQNEPDLLLQQLQLLLTPMLATSRELAWIDAHSLVVHATNDASSCATAPLEAEPVRLHLRIHDDALATLISSLVTSFGRDDPALVAAYESLVEDDVGKLVCTGLSDTEMRFFRHSLQEVLVSLAKRDL